jgi:hypothetical protein
MSFYDDASLVVIPSAQKTSKLYAVKPTDGSGDLAFTRTGDTATRVNSAGLIEKVRTNLALNSEGNVSTYNTAINITNATSSFNSFANAIQIPSTGTSVAYKSVVTTAQPYSISVYIKMDDNSVPVLSSSTTSGNVSLIIAGSFATDNLKVESVGNNVYRLSGSAIGSGASNNNGVVRYDTQTLKSFKIAGIQLTVGDVATDYIKTTTAAVSTGPVANVPRLDYTGSTCPRLLLEPQRTNLVTFSEQFSNANWFKYQATITSNSTTSPDGYTNADTIADSAVNDVHIAYQNTAFTAGSYTVSCYAKANTLSHAFLQIYDGANFYASGIFNLTNGTVSGAGSITSAGNGWYRLSLTATVATGTGYSYVGTSNGSSVAYSGSGQSIYIWGYQTEAGAYPTSLIPTLAASATRGADACSKTGISSLIGQTEGTIYAEIVRTTSTATDGFWVGVNAGTVTDWIFLGIEGTGARFYVRVNNVVVAEIYPALAVGTHKMALGYKSGEIVGYIDGVQVFSSAGTFTLTSLTKFQIGATSPATDSTLTTAAVKQSLLFKTRLTNAELAELTTL